MEHFFFRLRLIAESCIQNLLEDENNILLAMPSCYAKLCNILENESNESEKMKVTRENSVNRETGISYIPTLYEHLELSKSERQKVQRWLPGVEKGEKR